MRPSAASASASLAHPRNTIWVSHWDDPLYSFAMLRFTTRCLVPVVLVGLAIFFAMRAPRQPDAAEPRADFIRGVTVSCQTWGGEWARPEMAATMDELKAMGAGWIAIHPYARIQADGTVSFREDREPKYIDQPLAWAKERQMNV